MQYQRQGSQILLTIDRGEKVMETLTAFCRAEGIFGATLRGLGAVSDVSCGYYDLPTKTYRFTSYPGSYEVVSLEGNVAEKEGEPFVHAHVLCTDEENRAFGGHLSEMTVAITLEITLTVLPFTARRVHDDEIGLFLLALDGTASK